MTTECLTRAKKSKIKTYLKAVAMLAALAGLSACAKEIKEEPPPLGEVTMPTSVDKAINDGMAGAHIYYSKPGQYVEYDTNYKEGLGNVNTQSKTLRIFKGRTETAESIVFHLTEDAYIFDHSGTVTDEKHSELNLEMKKSLEELSIAKGLEDPNDPYCVRAPPEEKEYDCVKYYNLKSYDSVEPAPTKTAERADCGGLPGCVIPVRIVQFDKVRFLNGKFVDKSISRFAMSKSVPMLFQDRGFPPITSFCVASLLGSGGTTWYVNQCIVLRDLQI